MPKSKIPTGRKTAQNEMMTPKKGAAAAAGSTFKVPEGQGGFGFKFANGLAMQGQKLLDGLVGRKTATAPPPVAPAPAPAAVPATPSSNEMEEDDSPEPPRGSQTEPRPLKKKKRFSDIHRQQFAKMDSIATHYSANRVTPNQTKVSAPPSDITPKNTVQTPEMAPKGIKRSKSQAVLSDREIPVSPSPVKAQQPRMTDDDDREDNPSPVKRQKLDPSSAMLKKKPSKIARFAPSATSTPMKARHTGVPSTVAGGALGRGLFFKASGSTRRTSVFPKPVSNFNLTPATTLSATPSKVPTTPGRTPNLRSRVPGTAGGSKLNTMINFAEAVTPSSSASALPAATSDDDLPTMNLTTPAKGTPTTTVGGFTFRSRGSGLGFGALSEIHQKKTEMPRFPGQMSTPKVSENDPVGVEDPFAHVMEGVTWEEKSDDMMWAIGTPAAKKVKTNKRKEADTGDETEEEVQQESAECEDEEMTSAPPSRKKLRFDTLSGREEEKEESMDDANDEQVENKPPPPSLAEAVAKANRKRRLNYLATPKKRVSGAGDRLGRGKTMWK